VLDSAADTLSRVESPGSFTPTVSLVGPLGVDTSDQAGMDIDVHDAIGQIWAAGTNATATRLP
jgi:hypothetical protein